MKKPIAVVVLAIVLLPIIAFAQGVVVKGGGSSNLACVTTDGNLCVGTSTDKAKVGFTALAVENDTGSITGSRYVKRLHASESGRLAVGVDQTIFNEVFPGAAINTGLWSSPATTMTITVAGNFLNLNAAGSIASAAVAQVRTYRHFPAYKSYPTLLEMAVQFTSLPVANNVSEWGYFLATGTTAPTDGVFFRLNASGEFRCVINTNGVENQSAAIDFATAVGINSTKTFLIEVFDSEVHFFVDSVIVAEVALPAAAGAMTGSMNLPLTFRNYNSAATSTAQIMKVGSVNVSMGDMYTGKPWAHILNGAGGHASQGQTGGTMGTTGQLANSANPTAAVPTNTTAALGSGLGGLFLETDTLAVTTDGIISSYQVPLGTAALPGKSLYITRVTIASFISTVLTGGPYVAVWSLAYGHTAVSLATAEAATTKAPRRMALGVQPLTTAQAVSTLVGPEIELDLSSPIVVHPGEFIQTVKRKVGTAPSAGVVFHVIGFGGYWE